MPQVCKLRDACYVINGELCVVSNCSGVCKSFQAQQKICCLGSKTRHEDEVVKGPRGRSPGERETLS